VFLRLARMNLGKKQHFVGGITTSPDERIRRGRRDFSWSGVEVGNRGESWCSTL
jgi:hypothetical protein